MVGLHMTSRNIRGYSTTDEQIGEVTMSIMIKISVKQKSCSSKIVQGSASSPGNRLHLASRLAIAPPRDAVQAISKDVSISASGNVK